MVSALMGQSFPILMELLEKGVLLMAPLHQIAETRKVLAEKSSYTPDEAEAQMERLMTVVVPLHPALYGKHEESARLRLRDRGQPDWPVLAASFETVASIWSHDKDFFGSGASVWSTQMLKRQIKIVGGDRD